MRCRALLAAGAGYLTKNEPPAQIGNAIRAVGAGETGWVSRSVVRLLMAAQPQEAAVRPSPLTAREQAVLALVVQGKTNAEIAQAFGLGTGTVKNHVHNIIVKLRVQNRSEAVAWAVRNGIGANTST
jgi:DNA-binding NarL/FixJ family response regulator